MYWFSGNTNLLRKFSQSWGFGTNSRCREASWDGFWMALLDQIWKLLSWEGKCVKVKLKSIYLLLSNRYMYLITINGLFFHSFYWINFIVQHTALKHMNCVKHVYLYCRGMDSQFTGGPLPPDKHAKDVPFLDKYALERWEVGCFVFCDPIIFDC